MRIRLLIKPLGEGAFEARPINGLVANELRATAFDEGAPPSYVPVLYWDSLADLQSQLGTSISELKIQALKRNEPVEVSWNEKLFKQETGFFHRR